MREIIILLLILIIIIGGAVYTQNLLKSTSEVLVSKLEELKTDIENESEEQEELEKKTDEIYGEWKRTNEKWSMLIVHDEIDLIENALISMKAKIKTGNLNESMEDLDTSIFLLKHITEKEETSLKNIF